MVLEIKVPHEGTEWSSLTPLIPVFLSYVLSFLYIGIYWGNHHHLLNTAKKVTSGIMLSNLHLLFWLSLIPFTTGWMGENHFGKNAVALYGINLLMAGVAYFILQKYIEKSHANDKKIKHVMKKHSYKGIISQIAYAASIPLAYVYPWISIFIFYLFAIVWLIPDRNIEKALDND
jgi:uncharacterized membrane protein